MPEHKRHLHSIFLPLSLSCPKHTFIPKSMASLAWQAGKKEGSLLLPPHSPRTLLCFCLVASIHSSLDRTFTGGREGQATPSLLSLILFYPRLLWEWTVNEWSSCLPALFAPLQTDTGFAPCCCRRKEEGSSCLACLARAGRHSEQPVQLHTHSPFFHACAARLWGLLPGWEGEGRLCLPAGMCVLSSPFPSPTIYLGRGNSPQRRTGNLPRKPPISCVGLGIWGLSNCSAYLQPYQKA